ncbi:uncharacterized protein F5891DRAFT_979888 [Suillus fuscotomentosus]|uniref:Uncharacterized protein n=1 Tax=Suillus fuscotomentosus TaxID=1912939 RepID=A0AAD4E7B6_9AGAM|nr:uncharacterized protein F5891DRAFT_979888 [Suillus fuscotomentosus]KAG1900999.1 hypothetical protein F5891DRAFT_979888 [Suillus fuscotomentosus]
MLPFFLPVHLLLQTALLFIDVSIQALTGITPSLMITEAFLSCENLCTPEADLDNPAFCNSSPNESTNSWSKSLKLPVPFCHMAQLSPPACLWMKQSMLLIKLSPSASESDTSSNSSISSMEHLQPHLKKSSKKCGRKSDKGDQEVKKAKILKENNSEFKVQEEYLVAARAMAHCTDLFCNVEKILRVGLLLQQEQAMENGELEELEAKHKSHQKRLASLSTNTLNQYKHNYQQLLQLAPGV